MAQIGRRRVLASRFLFLACLTLLSSTSWFVRPGESGQQIAVAACPVVAAFFLPSGEGWVIVTDRQKEYLITFDGGVPLSKKVLKFAIENIFFLGAQNGWAVAKDSGGRFLLKTTDAGVTWKPSARLDELGSDTMVSGMYFFASGKGWIVGSKPQGLSLVIEIREQPDRGGKATNIVPYLSGMAGLSHAIFGAQGSGNVWIIGENSVFHTNNFGRTWKQQFGSSGLPNRKSISFAAGWAAPDGKVFLVGQSAATAVLIRSKDFGDHWAPIVESEEAVSFEDINFWDDRHGCAVGFSTLLYCTSDGGNTWGERATLPKSKSDLVFMDNIFTKIAFNRPGQPSWAVTSGGYLLKSENDALTWQEINPLQIQ